MKITTYFVILAGYMYFACKFLEEIAFKIIKYIHLLSKVGHLFQTLLTTLLQHQKNSCNNDALQSVTERTVQVVLILIIFGFSACIMDGKDPKSIAMQVAASLAQR